MAIPVSPENTPPVVILRRPVVEQRTGLSRSAIYDRIRAGTFPKPISLDGSAVGWIESEINDWINARITASRAIVKAA